MWYNQGHAGGPGNPSEDPRAPGRRTETEPMSTTPARPWRLRLVRGTCRWTSRRHRVLRSNRTNYTVVPLIGRYRLLNGSTGNVYDVDSRGRWCTCPSYVWDHCPVQAGGDGRCKHIAALQMLGLLPRPAPDP